MCVRRVRACLCGVSRKGGRAEGRLRVQARRARARHGKAGVGQADRRMGGEPTGSAARSSSSRRTRTRAPARSPASAVGFAALNPLRSLRSSPDWRMCAARRAPQVTATRCTATQRRDGVRRLRTFAPPERSRTSAEISDAPSSICTCATLRTPGRVYSHGCVKAGIGHRATGHRAGLAAHAVRSGERKCALSAASASERDALKTRNRSTKLPRHATPCQGMASTRCCEHHTAA